MDNGTHALNSKYMLQVQHIFNTDKFLILIERLIFDDKCSCLIFKWEKDKFLPIVGAENGKFSQIIEYRYKYAF